ncbi:MAG: HIT family protein [Gammaproteobacteria bacterium]|nr:HIT family protein [Gammaproteobacteria bacterium]MBU2478054.1 HIT family protein [Gammaproteobacteria bacterium]
MFELHPQLAKDCQLVGRFTLCHLLLMRDANYPWCILVPDRAGITEIHQLTAEDQQQLMRESSLLASNMATLFAADKMNIAALGNIVPQLHIHHIARQRTDPAWPAPVWGKLPARSYTDADLENTLQMLRDALQDQLRD